MVEAHDSPWDKKAPEQSTTDNSPFHEAAYTFLKQPEAPKPNDNSNKATDTPVKPVEPSKPAESNTQVERNAANQAALNADQVASATNLNASYVVYSQATENGSKPMPKEQFAKLAPVWEKALADYTSIKPEAIAAFETQAQTKYAAEMRYALALEKSGKQTFGELTPIEINAVSADDVKKGQIDALNNYMKVNAELSKQVAALSPADQEKYMTQEKILSVAVNNAIKAAGAQPDQSKLEATCRALFQQKLDEQKKLSPDLAKAIDAHTALIRDPKAAFAQEFSESMQQADAFKHADQARIQLAQAYLIQGEENKPRASALISEAIKNPEIAALMQSTADGAKMLATLNLRTPDMAKMEEAQNKLFPDLKISRDALSVLSDKSKDPKQAWAQADQLFKQAEALADKEVMERGGGKTVAESLDKLNQAIGSMQMQLQMGLDSFKQGNRHLEGPEGPQRDKDEQAIRSAMKDMNQQDMLQALIGKQGPAMQEAMQRALTAPERLTLQNMAVLAQKVQDPAGIRKQHAVEASKVGIELHDKGIQDSAKPIMESIAAVDPVTFNTTPEILGALKQAELGKQMNIEDGSAAALAYTEAAKDAIDKTQTGAIDTLLPGATLTFNAAGISLSGHMANEIPVIGGFLGGKKEEYDKVVDRLVFAKLNNAKEAQAQHDQMLKDGHSQLRNLAGDVTGVATSFGTGWLASKGLQALETKAPLPFYVKAPIVGITALAAGGLANNAVAGNDLLSSKGFIRNTVATGTTYAAIKGLEYLPGNQNLSEATVAKLNLAEGSKITGLELAKDASAQASALGKSKVAQFLEAMPSRLNPVNYTPFRLAAAQEGTSAWNVLARAQFAGWGGERTAQLFVDGAMNLAEYNTRQFAAKSLTTFGLAYGFGALNKGAAIYTGEHLDGKNYDTLGAYWTDMNKAGLSAGVMSSLTLPIFGSAMTPGFVKNGVGTGVTKLFTTIGVADVPAASAALGSAALMYSRPMVDTSSRWGQGVIYDHAFQDAQKRIDDLRKQVKSEVPQQAASGAK